MRTTILLVVCAFLTLNFKPIAVNKSFTIQQLQANPNFKVTVSSNGKYNGKSVVLNIESKNAKTVTLAIPEGTLFFPANEDEQTLIAPRMQDLIVNKKQVNSFVVYGFCTESHDKAPTAENNFTVNTNKNEKLTQLLSFFKANKGIKKETVQEAIWCVTDGEPISNIYCENELLNKKLKKRLSEITGQNIPWHSNKREVTTDDNGYVVASSVEVVGEIVFSTTKKTTVKSKVINEDGEVVFPNGKGFEIPRAISNITLDFKVRVRGWDKGKYYVLYYTDEGDELLKKEFEI